MEVHEKVLSLYREIWEDMNKWNVNLSQCEGILIQYLEDEPNNVESLTSLGAVLSDLGKPRKALKYLKEAEKIGSDDKNLYWNIAVTKMNLNDERPFAMQYFEKAKQLKANPRTIKAYFDAQAH